MGWVLRLLSNGFYLYLTLKLPLEMTKRFGRMRLAVNEAGNRCAIGEGKVEVGSRAVGQSEAVAETILISGKKSGHLEME